MSCSRDCTGADGALACKLLNSNRQVSIEGTLQYAAYSLGFRPGDAADDIKIEQNGSCGQAHI